MSIRKHWPEMADIRHLSRSDVVALINAFGGIRDLKSLLDLANFRSMDTGVIDPIGFDVVDQYTALRFIIDNVNVVEPEDQYMASFAKQLKRRLGALNKPIALSLQGHHIVIEPDVWLQEVHRRTLSKVDAAGLINAFGKARGLESLRDAKALRQLTFIDPVAFAPDEQKVALTYIIDAVNAAPDDKAMVKVGQHLKRHFGALNLPISVSLQGYHTVLQPQAAMH